MRSPYIKSAIAGPLRQIKNRILHYKGPAPLKVIVTAPPRSGTSFLAGLLVQMGLSPGPEEWLKEADEHNPYGYYECLPLMYIENEVLKKLGGSYNNIPEFPPIWTDLFEKEKRQIEKIVRNGGIEVYKGNRLLVLADLYIELFPQARWIMILRNEWDTFNSEFGKESYEKELGRPLTRQEWMNLRQKRFDVWNNSRASLICLIVRYEDFKNEPEQMVLRIANHVGVTLPSDKLQKCLGFFRPSEKRK